METVNKDYKITIAYTLSDKFGNLIEEVTPDNPLVYLHGHENIIPGLELKLQGKRVGDSLRISVPPEDGFGAYQDDLIVQVDPKELADLGELKPGMEIELYKEEEQDENSEDEDQFDEPEGPEDFYENEDEFSEEEEDEEPLVFLVKDVTPEYVLLDGNHRLAGKELIFNISILDIQTATFEEIEKGYLDYYNSDEEEDNNRLF